MGTFNLNGGTFLPTREGETQLQLEKGEKGKGDPSQKFKRKNVGALIRRLCQNQKERGR